MNEHAIKEAVEAIRGEIEYQDRLWGGEASGGEHTVSEWILFMQNYLAEAAYIVCRKAAPQCDEAALHIIRKVTTMGVRCMEQNGIFQRDMRDLERSCELHGVKCGEGDDA